MSTLKRTAIASAAAQVALLCCGAAMAQTTTELAPEGTTKAVPAAEGAVELDTVVVTGQRKALETAQKRKQDAEEIMDSVTADEAGKLPDKSLTEVLQRVVGVTMDHTRAKMTSGIDESFKFRPEGSGVQTRGLSWGSTTLNGRESFSAGWPGREISWEEVGPELMAGVDVYKNPSAEVIEGGMSSIDMRTKLPFDSKANSGGLAFRTGHSNSGDSPSISGMYSTRWDSDWGQLGALVDFAYSKNTYHNDGFGIGAQYPLTDASGKTVWTPAGFSFNSSDGESERAGFYGALQWKKNDKTSSLTYFDSGRRSADSSVGFGIGYDNNNQNIDIYKTVITDGKYDAAGNLQTGTLSYPTGKGLNNFAAGGFTGSSTAGYSESHSRNRDLSWNFKWAIDERWSMQNDLQWVHATNDSSGSQLQLGTFVPNLNVDLTTPRPTISFNPSTTAFLADPNNYYWNIAQPSLSKADADLYAWKVDGKFKFDDPVLRDFRFGMRLTDRQATHTNSTGTGWYSISKPWQVGQTLVPGTLPTKSDWQSPNFPYLSNPTYNPIPNGITTASFPNFFNGKMAALPTVVMPSLDTVKDYPNAYQTLANLRIPQCVATEVAKGHADVDVTDTNTGKVTNAAKDPCVGATEGWVQATYDHVGPLNVDTHKERTQAIYGSVRFGFDDWKYPVDGFVGLRVIRTSTVTHGYTKLNPVEAKDLPASVPPFSATEFNHPLDFVTSSVDYVPSLNLKMMLSPKLQGRLAMSQGMARPGFNQTQENIEYKQEVIYQKDAANANTKDIKQVRYTGSNAGNAKLKPLKSNNFDLSLEWYPQNGQSLTGVVFYKDIKDIIMSDTYTRTLTDIAGNTQDFTITEPANAAKMRQTGIEISGMTYLDKIPGLEKALPEWAKGLGISGNVSYLDGKFDLYHPYKSTYCPANSSSTAVLNLYGCDTNGMPFTNLAVPYMSKKAFNVGFMYDHGPFSARMAYSWRDRALVAVNAFGSGGDNATSADPVRIAANGGVAPKDVGYGLPVWDEAAGQWDASMSYNFTDHMSFSFSISNLTDTVFVRTNQQTSGQTGRDWNAPGRSYSMSANYWF